MCSMYVCCKYLQLTCHIECDWGAVMYATDLSKNVYSGRIMQNVMCVFGASTKASPPKQQRPHTSFGYVSL